MLHILRLTAGVLKCEQSLMLSIGYLRSLEVVTRSYFVTTRPRATPPWRSTVTRPGREGTVAPENVAICNHPVWKTSRLTWGSPW